MLMRSRLITKKRLKLQRRWCNLPGKEYLNTAWNPAQNSYHQAGVKLLLVGGSSGFGLRLSSSLSSACHMEAVINTCSNSITWLTRVMQSFGAFDRMIDAHDRRSRLISLAGEMIEKRWSRRWDLLLFTFLADHKGLTVRPRCSCICLLFMHEETWQKW